MPKTQQRPVMYWIFAFASFAAFLVVFGGFVRLTRSGLSIVEWNPVSGALPPLTQQAWQTEFAKYQLTPEFQKVNSQMTLDEYKQIFIVEWLHRILARTAGLIFAIPFFIFVFKKTIPWSEVGLYVLMGILFLAQAVLGWVMVASGLVDRPSVSPYLLTAHLFLALTLLGLALWTALGHLFGFPQNGKTFRWSAASKVTLAALIALLLQIAYGGFTAGLKAGTVSSTWPTMFGRLIPADLLSQLKPAILNVIESPLTVVFIHRWFAFIVLIVAVLAYWMVHRRELPLDVETGVNLVVALVLIQIILGIIVVVSHVQIQIALLHQANAIALFASTIYLLHRLRAADRKGAS
ncbi:MAG: COX15/CtaA family protein [Anaerolineales bacterium]